MKNLIIAGVLHYSPSVAEIDAQIPHPERVSAVVSGTARGVDTAGERWAKAHGIAVHRFPPDWHTFGRSAGPKRNRQMAEFADCLLAFYDGVDRGTASMIRIAAELGLPTKVVSAPTLLTSLTVQNPSHITTENNQ